MKHIIPVLWPITMDGVRFNEFTQTFLYAWVRGVEVLYIGQFQHGINRLFNHHVIGKVEDILDTDIIYFMPLPKEMLNEQEKSWIKYHEPKYNVAHNPHGTRQVQHITRVNRVELLDKFFSDTLPPEQVVSIAAQLRGETPKFLGKYCAYDCRCKTCNKHRRLALQ